MNFEEIHVICYRTIVQINDQCWYINMDMHVVIWFVICCQIEQRQLEPRDLVRQPSSIHVTEKYIFLQVSPINSRVMNTRSHEDQVGETLSQLLLSYIKLRI